MNPRSQCNKTQPQTQTETIHMQEPPPPRYVLQLSTGKWHKQTLSPRFHTKSQAKTLQNSLDYFLRQAMYSRVPAANSSNKILENPAETLKQIENFEVKHCLSPSHHLIFNSNILEINPIIGLFCDVPLYDIYDAVLKRKGNVWRTMKSQSIQDISILLNLDELYDVCVELIPCMVSREYLQQMISSIPSYREDDTLLLSSFFSFLVEQTFHPALDRNVRALFRAFDPDKTGVISVATINHKIISAWAELNLFGNLRGEWLKMAAALELTNGIDIRIVDNMQLLTPEATRAVFCTCSILYKTMESVDMDGAHLKASSSSSSASFC